MSVNRPGLDPARVTVGFPPSAVLKVVTPLSVEIVSKSRKGAASSAAIDAERNPRRPLTSQSESTKPSSKSLPVIDMNQLTRSKDGERLLSSTEISIMNQSMRPSVLRTPRTRFEIDQKKQQPQEQQKISPRRTSPSAYPTRPSSTAGLTSVGRTSVEISVPTASAPIWPSAAGLLHSHRPPKQATSTLLTPRAALLQFTDPEPQTPFRRNGGAAEGTEPPAAAQEALLPATAPATSTYLDGIFPVRPLSARTLLSMSGHVADQLHPSVRSTQLQQQLQLNNSRFDAAFQVRGLQSGPLQAPPMEPSAEDALEPHQQRPQLETEDHRMNEDGGVGFQPPPSPMVSQLPPYRIRTSPRLSQPARHAVASSTAFHDGSPGRTLDRPASGRSVTALSTVSPWDESMQMQLQLQLQLQMQMQMQMLGTSTPFLPFSSSSNSNSPSPSDKMRSPRSSSGRRLFGKDEHRKRAHSKMEFVSSLATAASVIPRRRNSGHLRKRRQNWSNNHSSNGRVLKSAAGGALGASTIPPETLLEEPRAATALEDMAAIADMRRELAGAVLPAGSPDPLLGTSYVMSGFGEEGDGDAASDMSPDLGMDEVGFESDKPVQARDGQRHAVPRLDLRSASQQQISAAASVAASTSDNAPDGRIVYEGSPSSARRSSVNSQNKPLLRPVSVPSIPQIAHRRALMSHLQQEQDRMRSEWPSDEGAATARLQSAKADLLSPRSAHALLEINPSAKQPQRPSVMDHLRIRGQTVSKPLIRDRHERLVTGLENDLREAPTDAAPASSDRNIEHLREVIFGNQSNRKESIESRLVESVARSVLKDRRFQAGHVLPAAFANPTARVPESVARARTARNVSILGDWAHHKAHLSNGMKSDRACLVCRHGSSTFR